MLQKSLKFVARFFAQLTKIIDVGATRGQFGEQMLDMGLKGQTLSFESTKATFDLLASKAKAHKRWSCLHLTLGDMSRVSLR